ncbi:ATP synthase subunit b, mitochondrial-like [Acyrthosiphon pisum]|uniref:ATP synthase subunit b n=1 Tax=Acyrthosiphon pisum TaxID=7029 RepID=A0A8R2HC66_ACYPI|nr:ATP synthase subunit b, mitochondrial-like [Acyrthosiphon pisum]|eukprot:XP_016664309.1 PREDICTED: ATP synthase subunit b, mitochondrial-like [Acyrthosiphon pisum]
MWRTEAQTQIIRAKRENVAIQLEAAYRGRLIRAYNQVKRRLDYQVDLANLTRTVQHKFMVNWIVDNVKSSINEKENFKKLLFNTYIL